MHASSIFLFLFIFSCTDNSENTDSEAIKQAEVLGVAVTGQEGSYRFSVQLSTPDLGCDQYADWWEVISEDGEVLYFRRILAHSHIDEQPFSRSGGPIEITSAETVFVRVHMNNSGYSTESMRGNVASGFERNTIENLNFGLALESTEPQPDGCAF